MPRQGIVVMSGAGRRQRAVSDEESLAALRKTWNAGYVIAEPRRHLMLWQTWTAWRLDASGQPLTARDAAGLGLAIAEDWARQVPLESARRRREAR